MLIAEGLDEHISRGYIYFAMGFSVFVQMLNLQLAKTEQPPVHLHEPYSDRGPSPVPDAPGS